MQNKFLTFLISLNLVALNGCDGAHDYQETPNELSFSAQGCFEHNDINTFELSGNDAWKMYYPEWVNGWTVVRNIKVLQKSKECKYNSYVKHGSTTNIHRFYSHTGLLTNDIADNNCSIVIDKMATLSERCGTTFINGFAMNLLPASFCGAYNVNYISFNSLSNQEPFYANVSGINYGLRSEVLRHLGSDLSEVYFNTTDISRLCKCTVKIERLSPSHPDYNKFYSSGNATDCNLINNPF